MALLSERKRVLVAGTMAEQELSALFSHPALEGWEAAAADSFSRARFVLQHNPCDVLMVHDELCRQEGRQGLAWVTGQAETPVLMLTGADAAAIARAYELGVQQWLPRDLAWAQPHLLALALARAAGQGEARRQLRRNMENLSHCRRHVDRLVNLLWRTSPVERQDGWFTQRHMLDRLQEELSRCKRHGLPLTVALGELNSDAEAEEPEPLVDWAAELIGRAKRRCDVAGQYGLRGFLLLLVHTPEVGGVICARRLQKLLEQSPPRPGPRGPIRAYFGLATTAAPEASPQSLLRSAEEHLEVAKQGTAERVVAG